MPDIATCPARITGHAPRATSLSRLALGAVAGSAGMALVVAVIACASGLARADQPVARRLAADTQLSAGEVAGRLSARGYAVTDPVVRRGSTYLTHGSDKHGQRFRLVMDARNGEIIGLRVIGDVLPTRRSRP
jgi:hypothetical protein